MVPKKPVSEITSDLSNRVGYPTQAAAGNTSRVRSRATKSNESPERSGSEVVEAEDWRR